MFVRSLSAGGSVEEVGGKAYRLSILARYFNVPEGFVITTKAYDLWKKSGELPNKVVTEIQKYFTSPYLLEGHFPIVVRSSANVEDSKNASFAGVFESITNIRTFEELLRAVERVFRNATSERVKVYTEHMGIEKEIKMAVLVQRQIDPELSGVLFTRSPNNPDKVLIELTYGSNEKLVSGKANAKRKLLPRIPKNIEDRLMRELVQTGLEIEDLFGKPQDIEWAYDRTLWILQSRDITITDKIKKKIDISGSWHILKGTPASPGKAKGTAKFILDDQPPEEVVRIFPERAILVTYVLHAEYYKLFTKASAIVTKVDSMLSHPAIIARELGIPCVVGVDVELIREGDEMMVDGDEGLVYVKNPRTAFRRVNLWKASYEEDELIKELKTEYLNALEHLDPDGLEKVIIKAFKIVKELYPEDREKAFNVYYFINVMMEENTPKILSKHFNVMEVFSRVDHNEKPRNSDEAKLFKIYRLLKSFINYKDERIKDIPKLLFDI